MTDQSEREGQVIILAIRKGVHNHHRSLQHQKCDWQHDRRVLEDHAATAAPDHRADLSRHHHLDQHAVIPAVLLRDRETTIAPHRHFSNSVLCSCSCWFGRTEFGTTLPTGLNCLGLLLNHRRLFFLMAGWCLSLARRDGISV